MLFQSILKIFMLWMECLNTSSDLKTTCKLRIGCFKVDLFVHETICPPPNSTAFSVDGILNTFNEI